MAYRYNIQMGQLIQKAVITRCILNTHGYVCLVSIALTVKLLSGIGQRGSTTAHLYKVVLKLLPRSMQQAILQCQLCEQECEGNACLNIYINKRQILSVHVSETP